MINLKMLTHQLYCSTTGRTYGATEIKVHPHFKFTPQVIILITRKTILAQSDFRSKLNTFFTQADVEDCLKYCSFNN